MKNILFLFLFLLTLPMLAQEISQMRVIGKGEYRPDELIDRDRIDDNGRVCTQKTLGKSY